MTLSVAKLWWSREEVSPGVTLISEPHIHLLLRANLWHVRGRDFDILVDAGNGAAPLRAALPDLLGERTVLVLTHTHVDHMGAAHEFAERWVHPVEAGMLAEPHGGAFLTAAGFGADAREMFVRAGYPPLPEVLLDALPCAGFDPAAHRLLGAPATRLLKEGDAVDLGDRRFEVLHVPGHSPGSIALWDAASGTLFAGDVVYDGPLIDEGPGTSLPDYRASFRKLRALPVEIVHAGHDPSFGRARLHAIMDEYEAKWDAAARGAR